MFEANQPRRQFGKTIELLINKLISHCFLFTFCDLFRNVEGIYTQLNLFILSVLIHSDEL